MIQDNLRERLPGANVTNVDETVTNMLLEDLKNVGLRKFSPTYRAAANMSLEELLRSV